MARASSGQGGFYRVGKLLQLCELGFERGQGGGERAVIERAGGLGQRLRADIPGSAFERVGGSPESDAVARLKRCANLGA